MDLIGRCKMPVCCCSHRTLYVEDHKVASDVERQPLQVTTWLTTV
jgi:hypothetical protein